MPSRQNIPTVRARALGVELERLRCERHMSPEDVAASVGGSRFKVRNLELAKVKPQGAYVSRLLALYGVDNATKAVLLELARNAWRYGWWTEYTDVFKGAFVSLEDQAELIRSWQSQLIPGLLQTEAYGRAVIRAGRNLSSAEVDRRWQARSNRQHLLTREEHSPDLHVVLDVAVLERPIGGGDVMRMQLKHLLDVGQRPNVSIQVLPRDAGEHAGLEGPLVILSFPGEVHPDIAYVEMYPGDVYLENADEVRRANVTMERIQKDALSVEESDRLISRLV